MATVQCSATLFSGSLYLNFLSLRRRPLTCSSVLLLHPTMPALQHLASLSYLHCLRFSPEASPYAELNPILRRALSTKNDIHVLAATRPSRRPQRMPSRRRGDRRQATQHHPLLGPVENPPRLACPNAAAAAAATASTTTARWATTATAMTTTAAVMTAASATRR